MKNRKKFLALYALAFTLILASCGGDDSSSSDDDSSETASLTVKGSGE